MSFPNFPYRGRIAPSPTGLLHLGHARTFWIAARRAAEGRGVLVLRNEDLDPQRCRAEFVRAMIEDLRWLGISWDEGTDCGGEFGPYSQSERREFYLAAWRKLRDGGWIYPCTCSRRDVALAASAPNEGDDEPVYPGKCRPGPVARAAGLRPAGQPRAAVPTWAVPKGDLFARMLAQVKDINAPVRIAAAEFRGLSVFFRVGSRPRLPGLDAAPFEVEEGRATQRC